MALEALSVDGEAPEHHLPKGSAFNESDDLPWNKGRKSRRSRPGQGQVHAVSEAPPAGDKAREGGGAALQGLGDPKGRGNPGSVAGAEASTEEVPGAGIRQEGELLRSLAACCGCLRLVIAVSC